MKQQYTFKILKYIYKELSLTDHLETQYAVENEENWRQEYKEMESAYRALPKVSFYPKRSILKNILTYSTGSVA